MTTTASEFRFQMQRMQANFIAVHHDRHDDLEETLVALGKPGQTRDALGKAEMILHKIAGAAGTFGMLDLGLCARQVEELIRSELATDAPDVNLLFGALDAFLDISLEVCNPTGDLRVAS